MTSQPSASPSSSPDFSILVGMVSTEDRHRILECLDSLRRQKGGFRYEAIIADRRNDDISQIITHEYPEVKLIPDYTGASLPVLRTLALAASTGRYIVVTEDHCVPSHRWLEAIYQAFEAAPDGTVAVGGCVENGVHDTSLDWATFFCEYSYFLKPVQQGLGETLPGMNVAYRREIFENLDHEILKCGFWETTLHPHILEQGQTLYSSNDIELFHSKKFSLRLFLTQRFTYSRYFADLRFSRNQIVHRLVSCAGSIILPPVLFFRIVRQILRKGRLRSELTRASPYLALFVVVWALGEMWGYLFGSGNALKAIE